LCTESNSKFFFEKISACEFDKHHWTSISNTERYNVNSTYTNTTPQNRIKNSIKKPSNVFLNLNLLLNYCLLKFFLLKK
jgi:hypothetical protein